MNQVRWHILVNLNKNLFVWVTVKMCRVTLLVELVEVCKNAPTTSKTIMSRQKLPNKYLPNDLR